MLAYARRSDSWQLQSMVFDPQVERFIPECPGDTETVTACRGRTDWKNYNAALDYMSDKMDYKPSK